MYFSQKRLPREMEPRLVIIEKIRIFKNMKRISINKYLNILYKYYCKKANVEYQDLINTKNNFSINEEFFDEIHEKYKYDEKDEDDIFYL